MNGDLMRLVDSIHRDKEIDKAIIFEALEDALVSAARRHYGPKSDIAVFVDRESGQIQAFDGNEEIDAIDIGRIAAQTAKQVIIQKIRDAEQDALFNDYEGRVKQIVSGTIQRFEGSTIVVNLGRTEGILPRSEQVSEEGYRIGDRIRCYLLEVRRVGSRVRVILSRAHSEFIRRLFELEVPEIGERVIEIMVIAREPGYRTKVAVQSADAKVDCVGACVGVRGSRIKQIVAELNDEKIDIVRWSESRDALIANSLKPAEVRDVVVVAEFNRARVIVPEEELSLAIGKRGRNVRLAAKLCEVDIDIVSESEAGRELDELTEWLADFEDIAERFPQRLWQMGYAIEDIADGATGWIERFDVPEDRAAAVFERAKEGADALAAARVEEEAAAAEAEAAAAEAGEAEAEGEAAEGEALPEEEGGEGESLEAPAEGEATEAEEEADGEALPEEEREGAEATPDEGESPEPSAEDEAEPESDGAADEPAAPDEGEAEQPVGEAEAPQAEPVEEETAPPDEAEAPSGEAGLDGPEPAEAESPEPADEEPPADDESAPAAEEAGDDAEPADEAVSEQPDADASEPPEPQEDDKPMEL